MKYKFASALLSLILLCPAVWAEPSEVSKYLINTPVDWMTHGINQLTGAFKEHSEDYEVVALYNYSEDRIVIRLSAKKPLDSAISSKDKAEAFCKGAIIEVKKKLFITAEGTPSFVGDKTSWVPTYFRPESFVDKGSPKDFETKIDAITRIQMRVLINGDKKEHKITYIDCVSALRDEKIFTSLGSS